jgi:hypothetical protein
MSFILSIECPCSIHPCVPVAQCVPHSLQYSGVCKTGTSRASNCPLKYSFLEKKTVDALRQNSWRRPIINLLLNKAGNNFQTSLESRSSICMWCETLGGLPLLCGMEKTADALRLDSWKIQ